MSITEDAGQREYRDCPFCGEEILANAKKCKHCGEILDPVLRAATEGLKLKGHVGEVSDEGDEAPYYPASQIERKTDGPGVISLIFGCLGVGCLIMSFTLRGGFYLAALPFAALGAEWSSRTGLRLQTDLPLR